jgi:uncharacterized protein YcbX
MHLVSTAALRWLADLLPDAEIEVDRFRPNVLVDADGAIPVEDGWVGREVEIGGARLLVTERTPRCVMVTMDQGKLPEDRRVLRTLAGTAGGAFGVSAEVLRPGLLRIGDSLSLM